MGREENKESTSLKPILKYKYSEKKGKNTGGKNKKREVPYYTLNLNQNLQEGYFLRYFLS
jgi:hypothetical protein